MFANTGCSVKLALADTLPSVAVNVTTRAPETATVLTGTVAELAPAGTVTKDATDPTPGAELERATIVPPTGATPLRFTVNWTGMPPTTDVGDTVTLVSETGFNVSGFTVSVAVSVTP
jgi:hypothetical protein